MKPSPPSPARQPAHAQASAIGTPCSTAGPRRSASGRCEDSVTRRLGSVRGGFTGSEHASPGATLRLVVPEPPSRIVLLASTLLSCWAASSGCARIPADRYGVARLRLHGVERLDPAALQACLGTRERSWLEMHIGPQPPAECAEPPFDQQRLTVRLWRWPWTEWPLFDRSVFRRDLDRIERWYRARGFYDARVVAVRAIPPDALEADRLPRRPAQPIPCERAGPEEGCRIDIDVTVDEGEPVLLAGLELRGTRSLPLSLRRRLRKRLKLRVGRRFDEALYDRDKERILDMLREAGHACARVEGRVLVDPERHEARVRFLLEPGPTARFGHVFVEGKQDLSVRPILGAMFIESGQRYRESALDEAQRAVYALGAFSSVKVEPVLSEAGCEEPVDVRVRVQPTRRFRFGVGAGIQNGGEPGFDVTAVRQWDVHLLGFVEHRNVLGRMGRLRIEERPRLLFNDVFPQPVDLQPGNLALLDFRLPAFLDPRTTLSVRGRWELGPEPFGNRFNRHDLDARIGVHRGYMDGRVRLSLGLRGNLFRVIDENTSALGGTRDYLVLFLDPYVHLDLRDDPRRPRQGAFFALATQVAGLWLPSSWDYVRVTPETRFYFPLPLRSVLAVRLGVGALFVLRADPELEDFSEMLGPEPFRLRGGGANGNRGFVPGDLGDGIEGGRRRWEASVEWRIPVTADFGLALFLDGGDVSRGTSFRFDHLQLSAGGGIRYQTLIGPLRLDVGYRIPGAQVLGGEDPPPRFLLDLGFFRFAGALHITIGEAF